MDIQAFLAAGQAKEKEQAALEAELAQAEADLKKANKKTSPFEFISSIQEKRYIFAEKNAKHYVPHVVNMGVSQFIENVGFAMVASKLQAQLTGLHAELANQMQYDYLYHSIRRGKKYGKWAKVEKYDNLELIQEVYDVNRDEGIKILNRLSDADIQKLIEWSESRSGGLSK